MEVVGQQCLQPGHYSSITAPNLQHTANQERYDQYGNQHHSPELLIMGIVMVETCWDYKKHDKIISGIWLVFYSYVYWTVHHLDSWIKIDQLDVTCFIISLFTAQHVSNVSTSISGASDLLWIYLMYCSGSMCFGVTVWFGWGGVVSLCRLKH